MTDDTQFCLDCDRGYRIEGKGIVREHSKRKTWRVFAMIVLLVGVLYKGKTNPIFVQCVFEGGPHLVAVLHALVSFCHSVGGETLV